MTLRQRLEAVWNDERISSPCHLNIWSETPVGYLRYAEFGLFWRHGKMLGPKKQKIKGKGFSYLCKFYQLVWRAKING